MKNKKTLFITEAAVIAAIYTVLVLIFELTSFGPIQFRVAEALTILPYFTPAAIPGVAIGCFLSAVISGTATVADMIFGSLTTLIAAFLSYKLRFNKFLVPIPPIVLNALIVPCILKFSYKLPDAVLYMMLTVGAGELLAAGVLGMILLFSLNRVKHLIFRDQR